MSDRARSVLTAMLERGQTLAVCETSAGGLLLGELLSVPGASAYCQGGAVAYSALTRSTLLGIPPETARKHGAVSESFALQLAGAIKEKVGVDWGLAETGIAGPQTGRRSTKPA